MENQTTGLYDRMMNLDRRWVYLVIGVVVVVTAIVPFRVPMYITPEVRSVYDFIESLEPNDILMIGQVNDTLFF